MTKIDATGMHYRTLCALVKEKAGRAVEIQNCLGQRYLCAGMKQADVRIAGTPGNALGAYLGGGCITVHGNAQDATGDTMDDGAIVIHGDSGDATGYAMRGGKIFVRGSTGYRAGIHMKAFQDKQPLLVVGESAGNFLGEYQAGGTIVVLGLGRQDGGAPVGGFCGTGMHGGSIFLRCETPPAGLPRQVSVTRAQEDDLAEIRPGVEEFCALFSLDAQAVLSGSFYILRPNKKSPYRQMYVHN